MRTLLGVGALGAALLFMNAPFATCRAQGTAFSYQGRLNDGGNPANGIYDLRFAVYDAPAGGARQGAFLTNSATVSNGVFGVTLDFGNQFPGADRWIDIAVRTNGAGAFSALATRRPVLATPYAIQAGTVTTGAISAASIQNATITGAKIADNQVVRSLNGLSDSVNVLAGSGISVSTIANSIVVSSTGGGGSGGNAWLVGGNAGGFPVDSIIGPSNISASSFNLYVGTNRALRLENRSSAPNIVGGHPLNGVDAFYSGGFIGGGGRQDAPNRITYEYGSIAGGLGNSAGYLGFVGAGFSNSVSGGGSSVAGGQFNSVSGGSSHIASGNGNVISGDYSTIGAGERNVLSGQYGFVGSGLRNTNSGYYAFVGSGNDNLASGNGSVVGGGIQNIASGSFAGILGGSGNSASGLESAVLGGAGNEVTGYGGAALGGQVNKVSGWFAATLAGYASSAQGDNSVAGGYFATAAHPRSLVWSAFNTGLTSSIPKEVLFGADRFTYRPEGNFTFDSDATFRVGGKAHIAGPIRAQSFIGDGSLLTGMVSSALSAVTAQSTAYATNAGTALRIAGDNNLQAGNYNFIAAGQYNTNTANYAGIGAGSYNLATGSDSFVGGGQFNHAAGSRSVVLGGQYNVASNDSAVAIGGNSAYAAGTGALALGGGFNEALGPYSVALGGWANQASGHSSIALGSGAHAAHLNSFVWSSGGSVTSTAPREFLAAGDYYTFSSAPHLYSFAPSANFRVSGDAHVVGTLFATRFEGNGSGLTGIVSTTAQTANYANTAGSAGTASYFTASLLGDVTGTQGATVLSRILGKPLAAVTPGANEVLSFDGTNWRTAVVASVGTVTSGTWNGSVIAPAYGGLGLNTSGAAAGSLLYASSPGAWNLLAPGSPGQVLKMAGGVPAWGTDITGSGGVTSLTAGAGLTGGTITTSGTIAIDSAVVPMLGSGNTFAGTNIFTRQLIATNPANLLAGNFTGNVGVGTNTPAANLHVNGTAIVQGNNNWGVTGGEGDFRVGNDAYRFKIGVATGGGGAGDVWMRAHGGLQRINIKAPQGVRMLSDEAEAAGVSLAAGGTAWAVISDRNAKKDFAPIDPVAILDKLVSLPITQWHYNWESPEATPHIGPMAQDFKAAFYPGADDKTITTQEADGVMFAAIQGLNQKLQQKDAEIGELKQELAELKTLVQKLAQQQ